MPENRSDEHTERQREAVERELQRRREPEERDLVDTVGEEQQRERRAMEREERGDED